jgi:flagellar basal body rod protein FlgB
MRPAAADKPAMEISQTALQGLARAETMLERAAQRIARLPARPESGDSVQLSEEMVRLLEARTLHRANLKSLQTADELTRETLKLFG